MSKEFIYEIMPRFEVTAERIQELRSLACQMTPSDIDLSLPGIDTADPKELEGFRQELDTLLDELANEFDDRCDLSTMSHAMLISDFLIRGEISCQEPLVDAYMSDGESELITLYRPMLLCNYWISGGMSSGVVPTDAYRVIHGLGCHKGLFARMLTYAVADLAVGAAEKLAL